MKSKTCVALLGLLTFLPFSRVAVADEIRLKNGDRITGEVLSMSGDQLLLRTSYAGEITIAWEQVSGITTDKPITVVLGDGTSLRGTPESTAQGEMHLVMEKLSGPVAFNLDDVEEINPTTEPAVKWEARVNVGASLEKGNNESEDYHMDGQLVAATKSNRYTAGLELDRQETEDVRTENNWLAYMKYDHFLTPEKWYINTNASFEKDDFKDISSRTILGAGSGYQFWYEAEKNLAAELGLAYVSETFNNFPDEDYLAARGAINFDWFLYKDIIQLFHWDEAVLSLEDTSDFFVRTRTGLRFPLYKGLTWTAQYNYDWDNSPVGDNEKGDSAFLLTIGFHKGNW